MDNAESVDTLTFQNGLDSFNPVNIYTFKTYKSYHTLNLVLTDCNCSLVGEVNQGYIL